MMSTLPSNQTSSGILRIAAALSLIKLLIHLALNIHGGYGLFRDELYYIACSAKPAAGYVDHPPLSVLLLSINTFLFGDSLFSVRLLSAIAGALTVWFTGLITIRLGGGRWAVFLACLFSFSLGNFVMSSFYSMNSIEILSWTIAAYLFLMAIQTESRKYWIYLGVALGLGLLNKIGILFLGAGIFVGLLATKERKWFLTPWPYITGVIASLIFLPYVLWNIAHDFAHLEFIRNASETKYSGLSPIKFLLGQLLINTPFAVLVWVPGLVALCFAAYFRRLRIIAFLYLVPLIILILNKTSKDVYLLPAYSILWAAGGVFLERTMQRIKFARYGVATLVVLWGSLTIALIPMVLPVLPVSDYIRYSEVIGMKPTSAEGKELAELPQFYADMFGWEEKAVAVVNAYNSLSPSEKATAAIFSNNYGRCGAIDYYGRASGLPASIGNHNNYWIWGPGARPADPIIILGGNAEDHARAYDFVEQVDTVTCDYCMPYENNVPLYICRGLRGDLESLWPRIKHYD